MLVGSPSLAVDAALVAPEGTWLHAAGDVCVCEGLRDGRVRVVGTVEGFSEVQVLATGFSYVMALSPKGDVFATARHKSVSLWDTVTGARTHTVEMPKESCTEMRFSPDGATLSMWGEKGLFLVDSAAGTLQTLTDEDEVFGVGFVNGGRAVGTFTARGYQQWSVPGGERIAPLAGALAKMGTRREIQQGVVGGDGTWVAMRQKGDNLTVFDLPSGRLRATVKGTKRMVLLEYADHWQVYSTSVSNEGIAASDDGSVVTAALAKGSLVWDVRAGKKRGMLEGSLSWVSADSSTVVTVSSQGAFIWDARTLRERARIPLGEREAVKGLSPDGSLVLVAGGPDRCEVRLYDAATGRVRAKIRGESPIRDVCMAFDGGTVAGHEEHVARLWDASAAYGRQGTLPVVVGGAESGAKLDRAILSSDGRVLVLCYSGTSTARVVDPATGARICEVRVDGDVAAVAVSPDNARGALIARVERPGSDSRDTNAHMWDMRTGEVVASVGVPTTYLDMSTAPGVVFAGENRVCMLEYGSIFQCVPSSGNQAKVVWGKKDGGVAEALSSDGGHAWVWQGSRLVQMDTATWQTTRTLPHPNPPGEEMRRQCVAQSWDGKWVAVAAKDSESRKFRICAMEVGGTNLKYMQTDLKFDCWLGFNADGSVLVCHGSGRLFAWDIRTCTPTLVFFQKSVDAWSMASTPDTLCMALRLAANPNAVLVVHVPSRALHELGVESQGSKTTSLAQELANNMHFANAAAVAPKGVLVMTID